MLGAGGIRIKHIWEGMGTAHPDRQSRDTGRMAELQLASSSYPKWETPVVSRLFFIWELPSSSCPKCEIPVVSILLFIWDLSSSTYPKCETPVFPGYFSSGIYPAPELSPNVKLLWFPCCFSSENYLAPELS